MSASDRERWNMTPADRNVMGERAVAAAIVAVALWAARHGSSLTVQYLFSVAMISTKAWSVTGLRMYPATLSW